MSYAERAREELALLAKLGEMLREVPSEAQAKFFDMFTTSKRLLTRLEMIQA